MKHLYNFRTFSILESEKTPQNDLEDDKKLINKFIESFGEKLNIPKSRNIESFFTKVKNLFSQKKRPENLPSIKEMIDHINNLMYYFKGIKLPQKTSALLDNVEILDKIKVSKNKKELYNYLFEKIKDVVKEWNKLNKDKIEIKIFN
jgi:hypothetical protein